jgi:hypothetical protein
MFENRSNVYGKIVESKDGEFNLESDIKMSEIEEDNYHNILLVRVPEKNIVFPFHADMFIKWFHKQKSHPHTREGIEYLKKRIEFKEMCLRELPVVAKKEVTLEYRMRFVPVDSLKGLTLEQRAFVDTGVLERCGWIHDDKDFDVSIKLLMDKPVKSWFLRKSSRHNRIMKNAEILVLVYRTDKGLERQKRFSM